MKLRKQEYEDLKSAVSIAIRNAPENSPNFKQALERLLKKLWKKDVEEHFTTTLAERVIKTIKAKEAAKKGKKK